MQSPGLRVHSPSVSVLCRGLSGCTPWLAPELAKAWGISQPPSEHQKMCSCYWGASKHWSPVSVGEDYLDILIFKSFHKLLFWDYWLKRKEILANSQETGAWHLWCSLEQNCGTRRESDCGKCKKEWMEKVETVSGHTAKEFGSKGKERDGKVIGMAAGSGSKVLLLFYEIIKYRRSCLVSRDIEPW